MSDEDFVDHVEHANSKLLWHWCEPWRGVQSRPGVGEPLLPLLHLSIDARILRTESNHVDRSGGGKNQTRTPFANWKGTKGLPWWKAYNETKHSRHENFEKANFGNMLDAFAGLVVLLAAQFYTDDFGQSYYVAEGGAGDDFEYAIGGYFLVKFPQSWPAGERYAFDWQQLGQQANPIQLFPIPCLAVDNFSRTSREQIPRIFPGSLVYVPAAFCR